MKITYHTQNDLLRILFGNSSIEESDEDKPGAIIDYDKEGNVVGMEILDASKRMDKPRAVDYAVIGKGKEALMSICLTILANDYGA